MPALPESLKNKFSENAEKIQVSGIREFDNQISTIDGLIKLTLGEPDMDTPEHVKEAAIASIANNDSHYGPQAGKRELRQAISNFLEKTIGVSYDPDTEISVTVGASEALAASILSLANPGDKFIIPTPIFSFYWPMVSLGGAESVLVDVSKDNFILTPQKLEEVLKKEGDRVKGVILNYPSNPSGVEYTKEQIKALAKVIKDHDLFVITDEIYSGLTYGIDHYSIAKEIPERTIFVSGLSKSHAMTGYRLGFVAAPKEAMAQLNKIHGFLVATASNASQAAALEALTNGLDDIEAARQKYEKRRNYVYRELQEIGLQAVKPQGAFYIFIKAPEKYHNDGYQFALDLAQKAKVGVIPGNAFGPGGEGYVRLSYAASDENLHEALKRIKKFVEEGNNND
ncbi:aminotransferase class I/II-fold pyridoxal phosphate-dependent enzyme [Lactobacillus sp. PV037]|uniref:aminotransferase class I/II-fold pyridoxal phosphate-dependent enzyme n=1 Tax=Lactobacillus sp. PV037 TaxID=2594496 RepID=UPI00223F781D|nr:aminotransferase class I/II-fold pyridoxal phosphate-dependent enzyme [Lactobacillus sp. PV037]QNQ83901.1 aminotransferase class I/II-fold pyridoxal phosphate-dependent enzyme [Lactobacillus sp. PV037]